MLLLGMEEAAYAFKIELFSRLTALAIERGVALSLKIKELGMVHHERAIKGLKRVRGRKMIRLPN